MARAPLEGKSRLTNYHHADGSELSKDPHALIIEFGSNTLMTCPFFLFYPKQEEPLAIRLICRARVHVRRPGAT